MHIVLLSSQGRCGIYEYSQILRGGFEALGHTVTYWGVPNWDDRRVWEAVRRVRPEHDLIIVEYEPGIFRLRTLVRAIAWLRFVRRKRVALSIHEIEPAKFPEYRHIQQRLSQPTHFGSILEIPRLTCAALDVALRYFVLRLFLFLLGKAPHRVVIHSQKARENVGLVTHRVDAVASIPLVIKPQDGDVAELRAALSLPAEQFLFIIPGFIFRRKRILKVIEELPPDSTLLIVGTPAVYERDYVHEVEAHIANHPHLDVRLIQDYERMELYLQAADAVVLFYDDVFQSASACLALGAGKPCIFSDIPAFTLYREGGLLVGEAGALGAAMRRIQDPEVYERLQRGALALREQYSPPRIAARYLEAVG
jgi:glycosyltransferase involved in cell wall biosynthesis